MATNSVTTFEIANTAELTSGVTAICYLRRLLVPHKAGS